MAKDILPLPRSLLEADARTLWVYANLLAKADEQGNVAIKANSWCEEIGLTRQHIRTLFHKLKSKGLITINSSNAITIITLNGFNPITESFKEYPMPIVFNKPRYGEIRQYVMGNSKRWNDGYVYGIEFGQFVKIGYSQNPYDRFIALRNKIPKENNVPIGLMVLSPPCLNYKALEYEVHSALDSVRFENTELFTVDFDSVVNIFNTLKYDHEDV